jgi:hypothetical protein
MSRSIESTVSQPRSHWVKLGKACDAWVTCNLPIGHLGECGPRPSRGERGHRPKSRSYWPDVRILDNWHRRVLT